MNNHLEEANALLEPIVKQNNFPSSVHQIFRSVQGSLAFGMILVHLYINAANKQGKDDFTVIIKDKKINSAQNAYKSIMFFLTISTLTSYVFLLENLFKKILEDKKIKPKQGFGKLTNQICILTNRTSRENDIFCILREMRNSLHGNIKFDGKKELSVKIDNYLFEFKKGKSTIHQHDYTSKIILESSKIIKKIMETVYPN